MHGALGQCPTCYLHAVSVGNRKSLRSPHVSQRAPARPRPPTGKQDEFCETNPKNRVFAPKKDDPSRKANPTKPTRRNPVFPRSLDPSLRPLVPSSLGPLPYVLHVSRQLTRPAAPTHPMAENRFSKRKNRIVDFENNDCSKNELKQTHRSRSLVPLFVRSLDPSPSSFRPVFALIPRLSFRLHPFSLDSSPRP